MTGRNRLRAVPGNETGLTSPDRRSPTVCDCYPPQCFHARRNMTPFQRDAADRRMAERTNHPDKEAVRRDRRK